MNESANGAAPANDAVSKPPRIIAPRDDPAASAAAQAIRLALRALAAYQAPALDGDAEAVHQMRIATRRLRVALELFAEVLHGGWVNVARRELKWLGEVIGALRDCDVIGQVIEDRAGKLPPEISNGIEPIRNALSERRTALLGTMRRALASRRYEMLLQRIAAVPAKKLPPAATVAAMAPRLVAPIAHRVDRAGSKLKPESGGRAFHKLRIRIKRLRYSFEMLAEAGDGEMQSAVKQLQKMQGLLGEQHDAVITAQWLLEFAAAPSSPPPAALVVSGALIQSLGRRASRLTQRCLKRWRKLDRGGVIRDALREVAHGAARPARDQTQSVEAA